MRKFFQPICFIAAVALLTSCAGNPPESEETAVQPASNAQTTIGPDSSATPAGLTPSTVTVNPGATTTQQTTTTQQPAPTQGKAVVPVQQSTSKATAGLNPAHGQPGHRCDIEVGAPLNSAPKTQQVQTAPPSAVPTTPAPTNGSVKLNPAHGQPGHDCAIPVGQPLKG
jgi:hypothetical protein